MNRADGKYIAISLLAAVGIVTVSALGVLLFGTKVGFGFVFVLTMVASITIGASWSASREMENTQ